jgi:hypothetical protein
MQRKKKLLEWVIKTNKNPDLNPRILQLIKDLNSSYALFLREGTSLKDKIDGVEEKIDEEQRDSELEKTRDRFVENLDRLVDTLVLTSGKLDDLVESCKKFRDLTTSFLCYSLSRFRKNEKAEKRDKPTI